ncbi:hypothetical protein [Rhizobium leguminosarum]|uniref:hypothetical protein n=1 Tax=Rhizobium leguminosarum TaxID=384 RepID=UPI0028F410CF|nr:hypothetical protein [Rhizobium leguminosarum]
MLIDTGCTPKLAAICGSEVVTIVPSRICMKKETATTSATIFAWRPPAASCPFSLVSAVVIDLPMKIPDDAAGKREGSRSEICRAEEREHGKPRTG